MGLIRRKIQAGPQEAGIFLRAQHRIGRDSDNDLVIARPAISGRHAVLAWTATGWVLRDSSKFGTLVNGALVKGTAAPVHAGAELTFVEVDEVWVLDNSAAPGLILAPVDGGAPIQVDHDAGLRAFPSAEEPRQTLMQVGDGWFVESDDGGRRRLADGADIDLGGVAYRVSVPPALVQTAEPDNPASPFSLETAQLDIVVHRGEDEAEVRIRAGGVERIAKASRPLYLLAYLAEQSAKSPTGDAWVPTDMACRDLGVDRTVLNVDVHRVREAVKATGLVNGANVVERRPSQIRIGVPASRCTIVRG